MFRTKKNTKVNWFMKAKLFMKVLGIIKRITPQTMPLQYPILLRINIDRSILITVFKYQIIH